MGRFLRVAGIDDRPDQPHHVRIFDLPRNQVGQDLVIDGWKELADVGFQHVPETASIVLGSADRRVTPFALAAGIRIGNKRPLEDRFQHAS